MSPDRHARAMLPIPDRPATGLTTYDAKDPDTGTTVTPDYTARTSRFTGKISWIQLDLGDDDHDHFIDPEDRLRVAMSRQ